MDIAVREAGLVPHIEWFSLILKAFSIESWFQILSNCSLLFKRCWVGLLTLQHKCCTYMAIHLCQMHTLPLKHTTVQSLALICWYLLRKRCQFQARNLSSSCYLKRITLFVILLHLFDLKIVWHSNEFIL